jgi:hypothetical protein
LTFLKRTSLIDHHKPKGAGPHDQRDSNGSLEDKITAAGGPVRSPRGVHDDAQLEHHQHHHQQQQDATAGHSASDTTERPSTQQSSDSAEHGIRSRVGSVKKRLSSLSIGGVGKIGVMRKASKASMGAGGSGNRIGEVVDEE